MLIVYATIIQSGSMGFLAFLLVYPLSASFKSSLF
jgi:hypothetical protein